MSDLRLTLAVGDYDQTRDLALGRVRPKGIDLTVLNYDVEEIFYRFHDRLEWDVSELSMGMYTSAISRGDDRFIAIPVFPSRFFRHSGIYVRRDGNIKNSEDLASARIGVPQWSQTAGIYVRGFLSQTIGLDLSKIEWVQAGVNQAGREEPSKLRLGEGIRIKSVPDRSLNDMLCAGDVDAIITARPPLAFSDGSGRIKHLIESYESAEADYFRETGIFPIMHTVAIRRDVYEANRWIARNLMVAFEEARDRSVARMLDLTAAHVPLPWVHNLAQKVLSVSPSGKLWPYGVEDNRATLEAFLRWGYEQGTCHRLLTPEEIFAEEALAKIPV
jgi:4,5-dihydroxyphthalate decarboxylase